MDVLRVIINIVIVLQLVTVMMCPRLATLIDAVENTEGITKRDF
jgi:hypothetical protein